MDGSNWVYLVVGILLGMSFSWLCARILNTASSSSAMTQPENQEDRSQLLQQIQQTQLAYQMAREMGQFKAGFLARTTHELRSPLNSLIGLHQLILSDLCEDPAEEREFITQAHQKALKLLSLMDEILSVARTEHGNNKLNIQPQPLTKVLQEVKQLTYMLAANRNFPLRVLLPEAEIYVLADYRWLRQVLVNLVDSSISKMEEGSICICASLSAFSNSANIYLDIPTHAVNSSELINLLKSETELSQEYEENAALSPGMKLLLNQTLLEVMGGKLEILPFPSTNETAEQLTRLQVSIPLASPEAEFQYSLGNLVEIG